MLRRSAQWATGHLGPATRTRFRERLSYFQRAADRPALSGDEQAAQLTPLALREARLSSREPAVCLAEAERVLEYVHNQAGELVVAGSDAMQHATGSSELSAQHRSAQAEDDVLDDSDPFLHEDEGLELRRDAGGTISAVPIDTQALVTEEFRRLREKEVRRRRQILYELMNPVPTDYQYNGKLVPVPPISFGVVAPESKLLGAAMFTSWPYHLVRQSEKSDYFFEINDLYIEIALVGRANAGKSSLINALVGHPVAKTSSLPHSTRTINFYQNCDPAELDAFRLRDPTKLVKLPGGGKQFTLVDIPGFGIEGMSDKWRDDAIALTDSYMGVRRSINTVIFCIDAEKGFTPTDRHYIEWLGRTKGLVWVVVTRADAVPHGRLCAVIAHIYREITRHRKKMQNVYPFVLPVSSHDGCNIDVLRGLIVETSGVVPGDKLREILRKRSHLALQQAREQEAARLERNRREEIDVAKGGTAVLPQPDQHRELAASTQSQAAHTGSEYEQAIDAALRSVAGSSDLTKARVPSGAGVTMKVHTGLAGLGSAHRDSGRGDRKMRGKNDAMAYVPPELIARAESGELAADMAQRESRSRPLTRQLDEHEKRLRAAERMSHRVGRGTTFVAERADGTVTGTEGGRAFTAAGVRRDRADRGGLVLKSSAEAAVHRAAMERANAVEDTASSSGTAAHMTSRERSAYERYNGTNGLKGEKRFWEEVNSSKIVNDTAWARNPRDDKQREYSQGARISWPNQPAGLSRKYGSVSNTLGERRRGGPLAVKGL